jgi:hypothetical protein
MNPRIEEYRNKIAKQFEVILPSGIKFVLKRLTPMDYIRNGLTDIPNEFLSFVLNAEVGKVSEMTPEERDRNFQLFSTFLKVTIENGIVDPPVILSYEKGKEDSHMLWTELSGEDQSFITGCITGRITPKDEQKPVETR